MKLELQMVEPHEVKYIRIDRWYSSKYHQWEIHTDTKEFSEKTIAIFIIKYKQNDNSKNS